MKIWDEILLQLNQKEKSFDSLYDIMTKRFNHHLFSITLKDEGDVRHSYGDLDILTRQIAYQINAMSIEKDEFVGLSADNSLFFVASFFGILMSGRKPLLINYRLSENEMDYVYRITKCKLTLTDNKYIPTGEKLTYEECVNSERLETATFGSEFALLTSGTTGISKVILYDATSIYDQVLNTKDLIHQNKIVLHNKNAEIVVLAFLPFYHIFGLIASFLWFSIFGRTFVFMDILEAKRIQYAIKTYGVTHFFAVPLVWHGVSRAVYGNAKKRGKERTLKQMLRVSVFLQRLWPKFGKWIAKNVLFKNVRKEIFGASPSLLISGGSHINKETLLLFNGLGYRLFNGYGLTESGIVSVNLSKKIDDILLGHVGFPFQSFQYYLDEQGCLYLKSSSLFKGELSEKGFMPRNEEYFKTRDIFITKQKKGLLHFSRNDEIIITQDGENIHPLQIEEKLTVNSCIEFVCLFQPDDTLSNDKVLVFKYVEGTTESMKLVAYKQLIDSMEVLPLHERITKVFETKESFLTSLNKVRRSILKETYKKYPDKFFSFEKKDEMTKSITSTLEEEITHMLASILNIDISTITAHDHFVTDLAMTSLDYYSFFHAIAEFYKIDFMIEEAIKHHTIKSVSFSIKERIEQNI